MYFTLGYSSLARLNGRFDDARWMEGQYEALRPLIKDAERFAVERDHQ